MEIVRRGNEAFNQAQGVNVDDVHAEIEWMAAREDPDAATHRGVEALERYFDSWREMIDGIQTDVMEIREGDDTVFAWIRITGTGASSGAAVEMQQAQVWRFRDGKAIRVEEYFDRHEGLQAAGLGS